MHVSWDKLSSLSFVAPKSNLFLNCCSYYLVISIKTFQLTMYQIHRGPLIPFASDRVSIEGENRSRSWGRGSWGRQHRRIWSQALGGEEHRRCQNIFTVIAPRSSIPATPRCTRSPCLSTAPPLSSIKLTGRSCPDSHPSPFRRPSHLQEPNTDAPP